MEKPESAVGESREGPPTESSSRNRRTEESRSRNLVVEESEYGDIIIIKPKAEKEQVLVTG